MRLMFFHHGKMHWVDADDIHTRPGRIYNPSVRDTPLPRKLKKALKREVQRLVSEQLHLVRMRSRGARYRVHWREKGGWTLTYYLSGRRP